MVFPVIPIAFVIVGAMMWLLLPVKAPKASEVGKWMVLIGLFVFALANEATWKATVHL